MHNDIRRSKSIDHVNVSLNEGTLIIMDAVQIDLTKTKDLLDSAGDSKPPLLGLTSRSEALLPFDDQPAINWLDHKDTDNRVSNKILKVSGMSCPSCEMRIENKLKKCKALFKWRRVMMMRLCA